MLHRAGEHIKTPLGIIFLTIFIDLLGVGILIPVIPQLFANPDSHAYLLAPTVSLDTGYILLGLLLAIYPFGQFIATPILGQLSDRYGRKPVLFFSILGTALGYIVFALALYSKNIPLLFVSRFIDGISGGNISVAQAAIADTTKPEDRAKNFGLIGAAFGLGFILGPFIGGKLADPNLVSWFSAATPFWFAAGLAVVNLFFIALAFPETNPIREIKPIKLNQSIANIRWAFSLPELRPLFITNFLYVSGFSFFVTFFSVFLIARLGFTEGQIGNYFAYVGLWVAFTQIFITRRVSAQKNEVRVLSFSLIGTGIALIGYFFITKSYHLLFIAPFFAITNGLSVANLTALISRKASASVQGEVLGLSASVQALAQMLPPALSGFIAAVVLPTTPIAVSLVCILASGLYFISRERPMTPKLP